MIKQKKSKKFIYILTGAIIAAVLAIAFIDIEVNQSVVEQNITVKAQ